ncbi:GNAT family N-acetyltransferase [Bowmanella dokdonensis]|uniref:GNAT family N-acetyltransferase n=2 Tax=Bowmanella dokdonensis TaxID=751969 RepID=A0A939DNI8_9ALTE|nr:GNAT family N-acetyltransferase [Bowmanella dokdonensis]
MVEHLEAAGLFLSDDEHWRRIAHDYHCYHLVIWQGQRIGNLKYRLSRDEVTIMQLQIDPEYQGRGLGAQVVRQVLAGADGRPVKLTVLKQNPALNLYLRLGFKITGEDQYEFHMQAQP